MDMTNLGNITQALQTAKARITPSQSTPSPPNGVTSDNQQPSPPKLLSQATDLSTKYHADQNVIQSIVKDDLSDEIIRKLPSDEFIDLLRLVDEYLQNHVDNNA